MKFVGIDIGTTTVCGIVFNMRNRKIDTVTLRNNASLHSSNPWEKTQDPDKLMCLVLDILKIFSDKYVKIAGIGFTGQMHGILYTDKNGNAVSPLFTWEDKRGNLHLANGQSYVSYLTSNSGYNLASGYGLVTHFYNLRNKLVPEGAVSLCTIMDYMVMKLVGKNLPVIDATNAASLGFFDIRKLVFDQEALLNLGIRTDILPEIVPSGAFVGLYKGQTPVYSAIGDNQASFLGSVCQIDKAVLINIGTGSQISVYSKEFIVNETLDIRPFPGGGYLLVGAALYGGKSLVLLNSFFEKTLQFFSQECLDGNDFYKKLNSIDRSLLTGQNCLNVLPLFNGSRSNPSVLGAISQISDANFTPESLMAGFLKGICSELLNFFNELPVLMRSELNKIIGSGNAVRQNLVLREMLEITFEKRLFISVYTEEAAFGACICAIVGGNHVSGFLNGGSLIDIDNP